MLSFHRLSRPISLFFVVAIINSCAALCPQPGQNIYYATPPVTFIRESPNYDSPNVAPVYRGDEVIILSSRADEWRQVQTVQSKKIGWIQSPLLSADPIPTPTYHVQISKVPLQDTPQKEGTSPKVLHRGDKVRKLSENQEGWWLVLVEKDQNLGWISASAVAEHEPKTASASQAPGPSGKASAKATASPPPVPKQYYYVATYNLNLHALPLASSKALKTLKFNDRVEKIDQSGSRWIKVRYTETGAQGWAQGLFLSEFSLKTPKVFSQQKRTTPKPPVCPKPAEPEKAQPEEIEPLVM
jgi:uncharacterized protein YgiM (DUF1202 family)